MNSELKLVIVSAVAATLVLLLFGCKQSPTAPPAITPTDHPCDTCRVDLGHDHHLNPNDTTSHNFAWKFYSISNEGYLRNATVSTSGEVFILGLSLYQLIGGKFVDVSPTHPRGFSYSGLMDRFSLMIFGSHDYWVNMGGNLFRTDGYPVQEVPGLYDTAGRHTMNAVWGTSDSDLWIVGDLGSIVHCDGSTLRSFPTSTLKFMYSVSGTSSANVWASGTNPNRNEAILMHYDGTRWSEDALSASQGINANFGFNNVWAVDSGGHHFAFTSGRFLLKKMDDGPWIADSAGVTQNERDRHESEFGVSGSTLHDVWYWGDGVLSHWNGSTWYRYDFGNSSQLVIHSVSMSGSTVCVAGNVNGQGWAAVGIR